MTNACIRIGLRVPDAGNRLAEVLSNRLQPVSY